MNLSQDCFITDNLNAFIEKYLKDCKDEYAAEHLMSAVKKFAGDMDEFPEDDWREIMLADGTKIDANFYMADNDEDGVDDEEYIYLYPIVNGETNCYHYMKVYDRKLNIVQPVKEPSKPKTTAGPCTTLNGRNGNEVFEILSQMTEDERAKMHGFIWWDTDDVSDIADDPNDFVSDDIDDDEKACDIIKNMTEDEKYDILIKALKDNDDGFPSAFVDEVCDSIRHLLVKYAEQKLAETK